MYPTISDRRLCSPFSLAYNEVIFGEESQSVFLLNTTSLKPSPREVMYISQVEIMDYVAPQLA